MIPGMGILSRFSSTQSSPVIPSPTRQLSSLDLSGLRSYGTFADRETTLSIPTASACVRLITGIVVQLGVSKFRGSDPLDPGMLLTQPDPSCTWSATIASTVEDLLLHGSAAWLVLATDGISTELHPDGLPVRARRIPREELSVDLDPNIAAYDRVRGFRIAGESVPRDRVVYFDTGRPGVLETGARTILAAVELEDAARRFARVELPAGILMNEGAEIGQAEAEQLIASFTSARASRSIAFLSGGLKYERTQLDPEELQLADARAHSATEIARLFGVPVTMVAASPTGNTGSSLLYSNVSSNVTQLMQVSIAPLLGVIESTLSLPTVTARGQQVAFRVGEFLRSDPESLLEYTLAALEHEIIDTTEARSMLGIAASGIAPTTLQPGRI